MYLTEVNYMNSENNNQISNLTDEEIVKILIDGNLDSFKFIILRYQNKLSRYIKSILINATKEEIEDILQEVFILVYRNINSFNLNLKFSTWIYRIAHNHTINYSKKHRSKNFNYNIEDFENIENLLVSDIDIKDEVEIEYIKLELKKALADLDIRYRSVLILKYFGNKSYEEISDILKIPKNTVGTFINRGKKKLLEKLKSVLY